jgi:DNA-binding protein WhiA
MSFTTEIKDEISSIECSKTEMMAELSGYIRNCHEKPKKEIVLTTENKCLVDRIINFIDEIYQIKSQVTIINNVNFSKKDLYQIVINQKVSEIYFDLGIKDEKGINLDNPPNYLIEGNSELKSYLRGVFLQTGSISDPKKSGYHLEFLIVDAKEAVFVQKLLNNFDFNAKILNREKGFMIYIKEADKISDFLKIIGANKAVLYYENVRVYRDRKNNTNRLNNMEQANMDKIIETANSQLEDIEVIEENDGLMLLDDKVKEALKYRKKYPEASLKELAEIISLETNKSITKSGLNHRLKKIADLANSFRKMKKE